MADRKQPTSLPQPPPKKKAENKIDYLWDKQQLIVDPKCALYKCGCLIPIDNQVLKEVEGGVELTLSVKGLCEIHNKPVVVRR